MAHENSMVKDLYSATPDSVRAEEIMAELHSIDEELEKMAMRREELVREAEKVASALMDHATSIKGASLRPAVLARDEDDKEGGEVFG